MIRPCLAIEIADGRPSPVVPLRMATGAESVMVQAVIRLWTIRGTWGDDVLLGLDHLRLGGPNVSADEVVALARRQLAAVPGVVEVLDVTADWTGEERSLSARIAIQDDAATVVADVGVSYVDGFVPGVWYTLNPPGYRPIVRAL